MTDERILVLMPTAKDGERTRQALARAGMECAVCADLDELCREIGLGAGVALLTEEAVASDRRGLLTQSLREQPAWSDFPLVVLAHEAAEGRRHPLRESMNATLAERPVKTRLLLSVLRAALRSRRHQYIVRDHLEERLRAAETIRQERERYRVTLASIGDAVIATDAQGRITFMNGVAESLAGWLQADAVGRPLAEVFHIVNENTRAPIENPALRALRDGVIVGLSNHTLLIARDGTERPIDDSAAPIRNGQDSPVGAVLVFRDVTERKRVEEELRDTDRKKDDFIALLAHELRNPLAPLRNGLQVVRLAGGDVDAVGQARAMMDRQLSHMVRLIDDLLDISRINRNKMDLRRERVLLADVVASAIETARPMLDAQGHELNVALPPGPVFLEADLTRLAQVFSNLLSNSAKYTERGGRIQLAAERRGQEVVVMVRDNGIGIPAKELPNIFDMFSQVDRSVERTTGGLGIGLALVKGLVEKHGGSVTAASPGEGKGSTFTVRLPVLEGRPAPDTTGVADSVRRTPGLRVLIVDDNRDGAASMAMTLRLMGDEVLTAHDGIEAVEAAEAFRPEIVLMDVGMPRLNGLDATRRIREQPWGRNMTIVALTGWGQDSDKERAHAAGCDWHLVKPVNFSDLEKVLHKARGR